MITAIRHVRSLTVASSNGFSGSFTSGVTPVLTIAAGAITPTTVNALTLASQAVGFTIAGGTTSKTLTVSGDATVSGTNTGDQTNITGNAATATALQTARTIGGVSFDGTANITVATATGGFAVSGGNLALSTNSITMTGSLAATGARVTKGWFTDIESTNAPTIGGSAATGTGGLVLANSPTITTASLGSSTATTQPPGTSNTTLATTAYADNAALSAGGKEACKYATTAALPAVVYANGASGVGATLTGVAVGALSVDGVAVSVNDRLLIKSQVSTFQNGLYSVTATGSGIAVFVLTRTTDFNESSDIKTGQSVFITSDTPGTALDGTTWDTNSADAPVMGTDAITFRQSAGPGSFVSGNGITITGNSIAIDTSVTVDKNTAQTLTNKTLTTPIISTISNTGTLTLPTSTDTLVGRATTDTLTNKTLTTPIISSISNTGTLTLPTSTDTLVGRATTDTLTNKTLTSPTLTTPVLGTPSSGTLTSCTGLPLTTGVTGTLPVANGGTGVTTSTGTGNVVLSASPTLTGTIGAAAMTLSSTLSVTGTSTLTGTVAIATTPVSNVALRVLPTTMTGSSQAGIVCIATSTSSATTENASAIIQVATAAASYTTTDAYGIKLLNPSIGSGSSITNLYGIKISDQSGATNNYSIYTGLGTAYFGAAVVSNGSFTCNSTSSFTGNMSVTGHVGFNTAATANSGFRTTPTDLTGTSQYGIVCNNTSTSGATTETIGIFSQCETSANSYTCASVISVSVRSNVKGSSSTITTSYGVKIENQTVGATNYALHTGTGLVQLGDAVTCSSTLAVTGATTLSGTTTISSATLTLSGNISSAAWTTNGIRIKGVAATFTDTTSSGTVATAYTSVLGGSTIAASSSTTFTDYSSVNIMDPIAGSNVTLTNKWALTVDSIKIGTSNALKVSNSGVLTMDALLQFKKGSDISPATTITPTTNVFKFGNGTSNINLITTTGVQGGTVLFIIGPQSGTATLKNLNGSPVAGTTAQIRCTSGTDKAMGINDTAILVYDEVSDLWRQFTSAG